MTLQMAGVEAETALIGALGTAKTLAGESRSRDAGNRCPAWMEALVPGSVFQEFEAAGTGRQRQPLGHDQLLFVQAHQPPGDERARKCADQSGRMESDLMEGALGDRAQPCRNLDAEDV